MIKQESMSKKSFKDYAHLYVGCEVLIPERYNFGGIIADLRIGTITGVRGDCINISNIPGFYPIEHFKLLPRPLSDMNDEEKMELFGILFGENSFEAFKLKFAVNLKNISPEGVVYLLSKHFDLFDLIPAGIAIDKTTLTPQSK